MLKGIPTKTKIKDQLKSFQKEGIECSKVVINKDTHYIEFYSNGKIILKISNLLNN